MFVMVRRLPPLNALKAFEAAARHESFTRAAEELCVTQGAVSHQVKALEAELGLKLFNRELAALYGAFVSGEPSPLPELPIQYADFSTWQRQWLQGEVLERQLGYWKQKLSGDLPV